MTITEKLQQIRQDHGPWTAHNIEISNGIFTISAQPPDRAERRAQLYAGLARTFLRRKSIKGLKILDLGCLEGGISISLAKSGAKCTGIDVRPQHLIKASFAAEALKIKKRCQWIEGDITRPEIWDKINNFDIVICSGLLYHLDANDILPLLKNLRKKCKNNGLAIIDTNIAPNSEELIKTQEGVELWGCKWKEHPPNRTFEERLAQDWSSFSNNEAFWLTERSLTNALATCGFGAITKPLYPYHEWGHKSRDIWLAFPGFSDPIGLPLRKEPDNRPNAHPALSKNM